MSLHRRLPVPRTAYQAVVEAPNLAHLARRIDESNLRLQSVQPLIPAALRSAIKAGPINEDSWCLLISGNAAAAKLRQLLPMLQDSLLRQGSRQTSIRLKIQLPKKP